MSLCCRKLFWSLSLTSLETKLCMPLSSSWNVFNKIGPRVIFKMSLNGDLLIPLWVKYPRTRRKSINKSKLMTGFPYFWSLFSLFVVGVFFGNRQELLNMGWGFTVTCTPICRLNECYVCFLFVWLIEFSSLSRIFHQFGNVMKSVKGCKLNLCSALMAVRQRRFCLVKHTVAWEHPFILLSPKTRDIHTCCRAFGSETVASSGLSRLAF